MADALSDSHGARPQPDGQITEIEPLMPRPDPLQERLFRDALIDNLAVGIAACGSDGRLILLNRTARDWHGLEDSPIPVDARAQMHDLLGDDGTRLAADAVPLARAFRGEVVRNLEVTIAPAGRARRTVLVNGNAVWDADGTRNGAVVIMQDITAHKEVEINLARLNFDLESRIQGRTQELEEVHTRLRQREAELNHISRVKTMGEMVAGLAHELNQPLAAIGNYVEACLQIMQSTGGVGTSDLETWLKEIGGQALRAGNIIQRLRRFVRKAEPHHSSADLNRIVKEVVDLVRPDARLHGVALRTELGGGIPDLCFDTVQVEQILVNLLRNAIESSTATGPDNPVVVRTMLFSPKEVLVSIRDHGQGFYGVDPPKLFEPFFTTKPEGLGMGLAICRSIVEAHHGRIWAEPNAERGASFHFTLPITRYDVDGT